MRNRFLRKLRDWHKGQAAGFHPFWGVGAGRNGYPNLHVVVIGPLFLPHRIVGAMWGALGGGRVWITAPDARRAIRYVCKQPTQALPGWHGPRYGYGKSLRKPPAAPDPASSEKPPSAWSYDPDSLDKAVSRFAAHGHNVEADSRGGVKVTPGVGQYYDAPRARGRSRRQASRRRPH